jgi:hypothetical protein
MKPLKTTGETVDWMNLGQVADICKLLCLNSYSIEFGEFYGTVSFLR